MWNILDLLKKKKSKLASGGRAFRAEGTAVQKAWQQERVSGMCENWCRGWNGASEE